MNTLRLALRQAARNPVFSAVVVVTLALGIGASTLIASVLNSVLLEPLPYPEAGRVVVVSQLNDRGERVRLSDPNFADLKSQTRSLASFAQYAAYEAPVAGGDEPVLTVVADVSREFFDVLRTRPAFGRAFVPEEQGAGAAPAAIVSYEYWQRHLGGTADFGARTLRYGDRIFSIVGVMPRGFDFPDRTDVWTPRELWPQGGRRAHNFYAIGRLASSVSLEAARRDFSSVAKRLKAEYGDDTWMEDAAVLSLRDSIVDNVRLALIVLAAAAVLLFAIATANSVNLLLARSVARGREMATRLALGARRATLARDFFAEALVLCVLGGALGVLIAYWGAAALVALDAGLLPRAGAIRVDTSMVAVALGLALLAAAAASVLVAWRTPGEAGELRGDRHATAGRRGARVRDVLVAVQVGIALVLAVGASLLARSYVEVTDVDPGFRPDGMLLVGVTAPYSRERGAEIRALQERVLNALRVLPGVTAVGGASSLPFRGSGTNGQYLVLNRADEVPDFESLLVLSKEAGRTGFAEYRVATEQYFETLGIPLLRGRTFAPADVPDTPHAAVVSRSLAEARWPSQDPLGKLIQFAGMDGDLTPFTVVGVVGDVRDYGLDRAVRPTVYAYYRQRPAFADSLWFALRTPTAESTIATVRETVRRIAPDVPPEFLTSAQLYADSIAQRRFNLVMLAVFGGAALVLALAGIYGTAAFNVAQRTREIGVRMALGAVGGSVVALIVRRSVIVAGAGIAAGLIIALGASRLLGALLYGISSYDPLAYAVAALALLAATAAASWLAATRAARVDPIIALRSE